LRIAFSNEKEFTVVSINHYKTKCKKAPRTRPEAFCQSDYVVF